MVLLFIDKYIIIICLAFSIFCININILLYCKRLHLYHHRLKHTSIVYDLLIKYNNYLHLRNIDPSFVVYNSTYKEIPASWANTVYNKMNCLVNAWAPYSLRADSWDVDLGNERKEHLPDSYRYTLHCFGFKPTINGPILVLEDPYDTIITEPIPKISNEDAASFVGKILFVYMTLYPNEKKGIVSFLACTNLTLFVKDNEIQNFRIKAEKIYTSLEKA